MRAAVLREFGATPEPGQMPDPAPPGPGQVLVRVRACGLCYTDVKIVSAQLPPALLPSLPHVLGHEPAGEVAAVGDGVESVRPGDRVAVYFYLPCGRCGPCRRGEDTLCDRLRQIGFNAPGAMADYVVVPEENVAPIAGEVPFEEAAVIADAVATVFHGLRERAGLRVGETVLVVGAGGLGLHAVQVAKLAGGRVIAADRVPEKLELARRLGAEAVVDVREGRPLEAVREAAPDGVDLAVDFAARADSMRLAAAALRKGGRLLMIGYQPGADLAVPTTDLVLRNLSVIGSRASPRHSFRETVRLVNQGAIRPVVTDRFPLERVGEAFRRLKEGSLVGRAVLRLD